MKIKIIKLSTAKGAAKDEALVNLVPHTHGTEPKATVCPASSETNEFIQQAEISEYTAPGNIFWFKVVNAYTFF